MSLVFIISAAWHGIHPAYYVAFVFWGIVNEVSKCVYKER